MGCGCGKGMRIGGASGNFQYELTAPGGGEPKVYLTALEASRERRKAGGGTIRRVAAPAPVSVPV